MKKIIESVVINTDPEDADDEVTISFTPSYGEGAYEMMMDNYICMSRENLNELFTEVGKALGVI